MKPRRVAHFRRSNHPPEETTGCRDQRLEGAPCERDAVSAAREEVKDPLLGGSGPRPGTVEHSQAKPQEGIGNRQGFTALQPVPDPEGKPQGRDRHETRPAGWGRSKAPRARETLRGQQNQKDGFLLDRWLTPPGKTPKGSEPQGRKPSRPHLAGWRLPDEEL
jgi:hypothetical protein